MYNYTCLSSLNSKLAADFFFFFWSSLTVYNVLIYSAQQIELQLRENRQAYFCLFLCPSHLSCSLNSTNIIRSNELPLRLMLDTGYGIPESMRSLHQTVLEKTLPNIITSSFVNCNIEH